MRKTMTILFMVLIYAVQVEEQSVRKQLIRADLTLYKEHFEEAITLYDEILEKSPKNVQAQYHREVALHLTSHRGKSVENLLSFEDTKAHTDKFYNYWLGRIHYQRYEFHIAKKHFDAFLALDTYKSKEIIGETLIYQDKIKLAMDYYDNPNEFELETMSYPINSKHDDLSPGFF